MGCDLGMYSAKAVIVEDGNILAADSLPYRSNPRQAAVEVINRALQQAGISRSQVERCVGTGFGGKAVPGINGYAGEEECLIRAIRHINPQVRTVIDVGSHTLHAFTLDSEGKLWNSAVTDDCSAGMGRFIELMSSSLEIPVDDLSRDFLASTHPVLLTNVCVVLAESDVISHVNEGYNRTDLFAGVLMGVAARIAGVARRAGLNGKVAMVGGVARNPVVVRELERKLELELADPGQVDPQVMAALGAALLAAEMKG
ncbi:MAG: acyl-CoA dehydratase activase [Dehalococcoidia bacterium]